MNRFVISSIVSVFAANVLSVADHSSAAATASLILICVSLLTLDCSSSSSITAGGFLGNEVIVIDSLTTRVASKSGNGFLNSWSTFGFSENVSALVLLTG